MNNLFAWTVILSGGLVLYYFTEVVTKQKIRRLLSGKQKYSPQEFGEHYFTAEQAEIAIRFRELLSKYVPADLASLRPDDRVVQDLGIGQVDGLEPTFLIQDMEKAFGISIPDAEAEHLLTVGQFVSYIALSRKASAGTA